MCVRVCVCEWLIVCLSSIWASILAVIFAFVMPKSSEKHKITDSANETETQREWETDWQTDRQKDDSTLMTKLFDDSAKFVCKLSVYAFMCVGLLLCVCVCVYSIRVLLCMHLSNQCLSFEVALKFCGLTFSNSDCRNV